MSWPCGLCALVLTIGACSCDESLVDELARYRDEVCRCPTSACVESLRDQEARWQKRFYQSRRAAEPDKATAERIEDLLRESERCKRDVGAR
jgi:hypothetical protein